MKVTRNFKFHFRYNFFQPPSIHPLMSKQVEKHLLKFENKISSKLSPCLVILEKEKDTIHNSPSGCHFCKCSPPKKYAGEMKCHQEILAGSFNFQILSTYRRQATDHPKKKKKHHGWLKSTFVPSRRIWHIQSSCSFVKGK